MCHFCLGDVASALGDHDAARSSYEQGLPIFLDLGDRWGIARTLTSLGDLACQQKDYDRAKALLTQSLDIFRELGARQGEADALANLGSVACELHDYPSAEGLFRHSLAIRKEMGNRRGMIECLEALARVAAEAGKSHQDGEAYAAQTDVLQPERAATLFGAAEALRETIKSPLSPADLDDHNRILGQARTQLDEAAWTAAWTAGRAMSLDQAVSYALRDPS
jgi:tetratricopeptide (TPR) repeat protein